MQNVYTATAIRTVEKKLIESGVSESELVLRAANAIFGAVEFGKAVAIVVGKGNNAADGFALSVLLKNSGKRVKIFLTSKVFSEAAYFYKNEAKKVGVDCQIISDSESFEAFDDIADCVFGTGFHGELDGYYKNIFTLINESGKRVISIDVPSGLDASSGMFDYAVKCDLLVAIGGLKCGNVINMAKDCIKTAIAVDIGLNAEPIAKLLSVADFGEVLKSRASFSNKGGYGTVGVMGGSVRYAGAAKLAAMSMIALSCGAGVSRLIVPKCLSESVLKEIVSGTLFVLPDKNGSFEFDGEQLERALFKLNALAVGMGMENTPETAKIIEYIIKNYNFKLIIDADGLNALSNIDLDILKNSACKIAITPHPMELSRLSGLPKEEIMRNPIKAAADFAAKYKVIVLLKGSATVISDGKNNYIVDRGCVGMATAGSGDVLSGILAGLLGYNELDLLSVSCGAFINGLAGEFAEREGCEISMTSLDTVKKVPNAVVEVFKAKNS